MRWFRRRPAQPSRPSPTSDPMPVVVNVEPAAETTAAVAPASDPVAPCPAAEPPKPEPEVAPARDTALTVPERAVTELPQMRHWHRAGEGMGFPNARVSGSTRVAERRVESGGWHRV